MPLLSISFLIGVCSILFFSVVVNFKALIAITAAGFLIHQYFKCRVTTIFFYITLGFFWVMMVAHLHLQHQLPKVLVGKTMTVKGVVASLPKQSKQSTSFVFKTKKFCRIQLNWYGAPKDLHVGDQWQLAVRLKRPHGLMNPGGFDYESYLFQQDIGAVGYVVNGASNQLIHSNAWRNMIDRTRAHIKHRLNLFHGDALFGFLLALLIGLRQNISSGYWQVLQHTGTNHLIAIAGLHIGLISGLVYVMVKWIGCRLPKLPLYCPAQSIAAIVSLLIAFCYALLAGFNLPTQRALIMLGVFLFSVIAKRSVMSGYNISLALFVVLVFNPLSVLGAGFWMSFVSVSIIVFGMRGRLHINSPWWRWGRVQWVIAIGLLPCCLWFFDNASLISPIANMIAVPWFGLLVMPLCFFGLIFLGIFKPIGDFLLWLVLMNLHALWWVLIKLSHLPLSTWHFHIPGLLYLFFLSLAVLLILAPRGFPSRYLSIFLLLPVLTFKVSTPASGKVWLTLLDVGQGLSSVLQTSNHLLVFDTGPKFSEDFNAGSAVVLPYLSVQHAKAIDMLMISHGDEDHIGGAESILQGIPVKKVLTSIPQKIPGSIAQLCYQGQHWQWDDVRFQVLWPPKYAAYNGNNSSCVLKIKSRDRSILLTGDIERPVELQLVAQYGAQLKSDILIAPHHGSRTSSSAQFIKAVHPKRVLFPVGYHNRFRFPSKTVLKRYTAIHAQMYQTANCGAVMIHGLKPICYRLSNHHVWND